MTHVLLLVLLLVLTDRCSFCDTVWAECESFYLSLASEKDFSLFSHTHTVALPILKLLEPALKPGAVMFVDNVATKNSPYKDLYAYIDDPANGWTNIVLPYTNGFGMAVKGAGK